MTAEAVATFLAGALQPFIQEAIVRRHLVGKAAHAATVGFSFVLALLAVYFTGGFGGAQVPTFSLLDPSPLLGFVIGKVAPAYALSQIVYGFLGSGATENQPGLVQKVAGTA